MSSGTEPSSWCFSNSSKPHRRFENAPKLSMRIGAARRSISLPPALRQGWMSPHSCAGPASQAARSLCAAAEKGFTNTCERRHSPERSRGSA